MAVVLLLAQASMAQIGRGQFLLGGNASYASRTEDIPGGDGQTVSTLSLSPGFGYFFLKKLAIGARFNSTTTKYTSGKNERHAVAPFLRYYVLPRNGKVNFFIDGSYSKGLYKSGSVERDLEGYGVMGGPVVFLGSNVGLEFTVSYLADRMEGLNWYKTVQGGVGLQIHLGNEKFKKSRKKKNDEDDEDDWWF